LFSLSAFKPSEQRLQRQKKSEVSLRSMSETNSAAVAVIGAGLRGLTSAAYLKSVGNRVRVFERLPDYGGVWSRVQDYAHINTPYWGYTFHHTNVWRSYRPAKNEILANLSRMIETEGLASDIALGTAVESVSRTAAGKWLINDDPNEEFDGVLVCPGFLGERRRPDPELIGRFEGEVLLPHTFPAECLTGKRVTVVGSGASAMDMFELAHQHRCRNVTLIVHPGTPVREIPERQDVICLIKGNPLLYRLTKKKADRPAAWCINLGAILATPGRTKLEGHVTGMGPRSVVLDSGESVESDVLVWCAGWDSPIPDWAREHRGNPTLVVAACPSCLDTAGFGYGTATAHAKGLHAALTNRLNEQFRSGTSECDCDQGSPAPARSIVLSLMLYYLRQPGGWRMLLGALTYGLQSNMARWRHVEEPLWSKLAAFVNAPLGF